MGPDGEAKARQGHAGRYLENASLGEEVLLVLVQHGIDGEPSLVLPFRVHVLAVAAPQTATRPPHRNAYGVTKCGGTVARCQRRPAGTNAGQRRDKRSAAGRGHQASVSWCSSLKVKVQ